MKRSMDTPRAVEDVAIIGAGLGGLATALALRQVGLDVQVYERARELRPVGAGQLHLRCKDYLHSGTRPC